jgi:hypothetical protein
MNDVAAAGDAATHPNTPTKENNGGKIKVSISVVMTAMTRMIMTVVTNEEVTKRRRNRNPNGALLRVLVTMTMVTTEAMGVIPLQDDLIKDSDRSCSLATRLEYEFDEITLPSIPTSALQLGDFQYVVAQTVVLASGRGGGRIIWCNEIVTARSPDELWYVPKRCRSLGLKLTVAAMTACEDVPAIYNVLRREGEKVHNEMRVLDGRPCVCGAYANTSLRPTRLNADSK